MRRIANIERSVPTRTIRAEILPADILSAQKHRSRFKALDLAMERAIGRTIGIDAMVLGWSRISFRYGPALRMAHTPLPPELKQWLEEFNYFGHVDPIVFTLAVPSSFLDEK